MRGFLLCWALVASACDPIPPGHPSELTFPEGFSVDTRRAVDLVVRARETDDRVLGVALVDGTPLLTTRAGDVAGTPVRVRVPASTRSLVLHVEGRALRVAVDGPVVHLDLGAPR